MTGHHFYGYDFCRGYGEPSGGRLPALDEKRKADDMADGYKKTELNVQAVEGDDQQTATGASKRRKAEGATGYIDMHRMGKNYFDKHATIHHVNVRAPCSIERFDRARRQSLPVAGGRA